LPPTEPLLTDAPAVSSWLVLGLGALVASTIGGVAGFGGGAIMIPLLAWTMGAKSTVPVLTVTMLLGNAARVWFSRREIDARVVVAFLVAAVPTSVAGALLYTHIESAGISRMIGCFMLLSVPLRRGILGRGVRVGLRHFPLVGAAFGFLSSLVGSVGPIMSPFFLGYGLRKGAYLATDALCTVGTYIPRGIVFSRYNLLTPSTTAVGLYLGIVMIMGAWAGRRLIERMSERVFLNVIEGLLVGFGLQFLIWPAR
jgi:uncharacterized membrane protein YfcA